MSTPPPIDPRVISGFVEQLPPLEEEPPSVPLPPPREPVRRPRITIVGQVVHNVPGSPGKSPPRTRHFRWLDSEEEAYQRTLKVGEKWVPLDLGWVGTNCGLLILANHSDGIVNRDRSEQEQDDPRVIEVALVERTGEVGEPFAYLPAGEDMRLPPRGLDRYRVRCVSGEGRYMIFSVPS